MLLQWLTNRSHVYPACSFVLSPRRLVMRYMCPTNLHPSLSFFCTVLAQRATTYRTTLGTNLLMKRLSAQDAPLTLEARPLYMSKALL